MTRHLASSKHTHGSAGSSRDLSWASMQDGLGTAGFVRVRGPFAAAADAWCAANAIVERVGVEPRLAVIGDFVIPPMTGPPSRNFQTLHLDFGLPLAPVAPGASVRANCSSLTTWRSPTAAAGRANRVNYISAYSDIRC